MKWITRSNVKVDRVACSWLISRFLDRDCEFLFAAEADLLREAEATGATPSTLRGLQKCG